jgi:hypothetical protein
LVADQVADHLAVQVEQHVGRGSRAEVHDDAVVGQMADD